MLYLELNTNLVNAHVIAVNDSTLIATLKPRSRAVEFETVHTLECLCGLNEETALIPEIKFLGPLAAPLCIITRVSVRRQYK